MAKRDMPCSFPVWLEPRQRTIAYIKWVVFFYLRERAAWNYPAQHDTKQNPVLTLPSETCTQCPHSAEGRPGGKSVLWQAAVSECQGLTRRPRGRSSFERVVATVLLQQGPVSHGVATPQRLLPYT